MCIGVSIAFLKSVERVIACVFGAVVVGIAVRLFFFMC